jgi:hypothetical protein
MERDGASRGMRSGVEPRVGGGVAMLDKLDCDGEGEGEGEGEEEEEERCLRQPRMMKRGNDKGWGEVGEEEEREQSRLKKKSRSRYGTTGRRCSSGQPNKEVFHSICDTVMNLTI